MAKRTASAELLTAGYADCGFNGCFANADLLTAGCAFFGFGFNIEFATLLMYTVYRFTSAECETSIKMNCVFYEFNTAMFAFFGLNTNTINLST